MASEPACLDFGEVTRGSSHTGVNPSLQQLGQAIRLRRKALGFSQEGFADACTLDRSHMGKIERGERNLSLLNLQKIAAALGVRSSELLAFAQL